MDSEDVPAAYERGDIDTIIEYCRKDVELTAKLWDQANATVEGYGFTRA